jgi:hypothetical protein
MRRLMLILDLTDNYGFGNQKRSVPVSFGETFIGLSPAFSQAGVEYRYPGGTEHFSVCIFPSRLCT